MYTIYLLIQLFIIVDLCQSESRKSILACHQVFKCTWLSKIEEVVYGSHKMIFSLSGVYVIPFGRGNCIGEDSEDATSDRARIKMEYPVRTKPRKR